MVFLKKPVYFKTYVNESVIHFMQTILLLEQD